MKTCSSHKCEQVNPQSDDCFNRRAASSDGLSSICKKCRKRDRAIHYEQNRERLLAKAKSYYEDHKEERAVYGAIRYEQNSEKILAQNATYQEKNKEEIAKKKAANRKANSGKVNAWVAKRRAAKILATPKWLTEDQYKQIEAFYIEAARLTEETGIAYQVDHIEPLQGENVRGFHVPWNLQILTASENAFKGNRVNNKKILNSQS
jgi:hypothetical protein